MKKIVLSLAALAALSTSALALTASEFRALERPENQTAYGENSPFENSPYMTTDEAGFAVAPLVDDSINSGTSYDKALKRSMRENPEHY